MNRRVWRSANALTLAAVAGLVGATLALEHTVLGGEGYAFSLTPLIHLPFLALPVALFRREGTLTDDAPRYLTPPQPKGGLS